MGAGGLENGGWGAEGPDFGGRGTRGWGMMMARILGFSVSQNTSNFRELSACVQDTFAGVPEICENLAQMSLEGCAEWKIHALTLPTKIGRYCGKTNISVLFQKKQCSKFSYLYTNNSEDFINRALRVPEDYYQLVNSDL